MDVPEGGYGNREVVHQEKPIKAPILTFIVFGLFMLWIGMLIEQNRPEPRPYYIHDTETISIIER